jgi:hypothetical protein
MNKKDKYINQVITSFQNNKGKSSMYCFQKEIIPELVYNIINMFYKKHNEQIFIVVDSYNTRKKILDYIINNSASEYDIKILSKDYINTKYRYDYKLIITIGINDDFNIINHLYNQSKFILCILTENIMNNNFITNVRNILPTINTIDISEVIRQEQIYSPVEEWRCGVQLSDSDLELYNKYTDYITTCINIFGELSNIEKCKHGDIKLNISATEFRDTLAKENGWREDLDTNNPFMKEIDAIYNPNSLFERACNFYNITKQRRDLCTDNNNKLEEILNICKDNMYNKILIVSKRGEFAAKVTEYINNNSNLRCGDYHDCIDDAIAYDDNNIPILIKSGVNKGKVKIIGSQAQSTLNEKRFNADTINILSIKNASNVKLKIACDLVIFTSSLCDNIIEFKTRFSNIEFPITTNVYKVYCNNTIENDILNKEKPNPIIKLMNNDELLGYDENLGAIIL